MKIQPVIRIFNNNNNSRLLQWSQTAQVQQPEVIRVAIQKWKDWQNLIKNNKIRVIKIKLEHNLIQNYIIKNMIYSMKNCN